MMGNFTSSKTYKDKGGKLWKITTTTKSTGHLTQIIESLEPEGRPLSFILDLAKAIMKQLDSSGFKTYYIEMTETKLTMKAWESSVLPRR